MLGRLTFIFNTWPQKGPAVRRSNIKVNLWVQLHVTQTLEHSPQYCSFMSSLYCSKRFNQFQWTCLNKRGRYSSKQPINVTIHQTHILSWFRLSFLIVNWWCKEVGNFTNWKTIHIPFIVNEKIKTAYVLKTFQL